PQGRRPPPGQPPRPDALLRAHAAAGRPAVPLDRGGPPQAAAGLRPVAGPGRRRPRGGRRAGARRRPRPPRRSPPPPPAGLARPAPPAREAWSVRRPARGATPQARLVPSRVALGPAEPAALRDRAASLLAAAECWVERTRPRARRVNLRPYLSDLRVLSAD